MKQVRMDAAPDRVQGAAQTGWMQLRFIISFKKPNIHFHIRGKTGIT